MDDADTKSVLSIEIRDPGVNMVAGHRPVLRRAQQPLTRMAADAVQGNSGYDVDGYNDYREVPVVGAWRWLSDYDMGIATEMETSEAFRPLYVLRWPFAIILGFLIVSSLAIFGFTIVVAHPGKYVVGHTDVYGA